MNVIVDYGVGNLDSVMRAFNRVGIDTIISKDPEIIQSCRSLILPGVGAFKESMYALHQSGLIPYILDHVKKDKYLFGICLGMQLLYERSYENGECEGLGLLKGDITYLDIKRPLKVPHMGWNSLLFNQSSNPLLTYIDEGDFVYFVHSYYVNSSHEELVAYANYDVKIPAIVSKGKVFATQFHPEKSGQVGLNILKAYGELIK